MKKILLLVVLPIFISIMGVMLWRVGLHTRDMMREQGASSVRSAVLQAAVQCYAVEGAYPPSLTYLEENYGLQINREAYQVTYLTFASNVMPDIMVQAKRS